MAWFVFRAAVPLIVCFSCFYNIVQASEEQWNPPSVGPVTTKTAPLCGKGKFVIQPFLFYTKTRGSFNQDGDYRSLPDGNWKNQFQEELFVQYGLTDKLEIDAQTVYQENVVKQNGERAASADSAIAIYFCAGVR